MSESLTIHGLAMVPCTKLVMLVAAEVGAEIKLDPLDGHATLKTPAWLEKQPFGQMPYIESADGFVLYESRAIAKYLAVKHESALVPKQSDTEAYARFEQACCVELTNFDPPARALAMEMIFKQMRNGGDADPEVVETNKKVLAGKLEGYERILSKHAYLAGDELTLADLFHIPYGTYVSQLGVAPGLTDGTLPNVAKWWSTISSRPTWVALQEPSK